MLTIFDAVREMLDCKSEAEKLGYTLEHQESFSTGLKFTKKELGATYCIAFHGRIFKYVLWNSVPFTNKREHDNLLALLIMESY